MCLIECLHSWVQSSDAREALHTGGGRRASAAPPHRQHSGSNPFHAAAAAAAAPPPPRGENATSVATGTLTVTVRRMLEARARRVAASGGAAAVRCRGALTCMAAQLDVAEALQWSD